MNLPGGARGGILPNIVTPFGKFCSIVVSFCRSQNINSFCSIGIASNGQNQRFLQQKHFFKKGE